MVAVDPSYPLTPLVGFIAAGLLVPVLFSSLIRESWNLGVIFLCFWLICENLIFAVNAILWSDNADAKFFVYCEIASHVRIAADIVKPMSTLIIMRRLYSIASLRPPRLADQADRRRNSQIEWTLGCIIPVLCAGPFYLALQGPRYDILQGFGCSGPTIRAILPFVVVYPWYILPAVVSVTFYYPSVVMRFYRHGAEVNRFLHSVESGVSQVSYIRILALASIDLVLTLPVSITTVVMLMLHMIQIKHPPLYLSWPTDIVKQSPTIKSWAELTSASTPGSGLVEVYFVRWTTVLLSVVVFAILGLTKGARELYWSALHTAMRWLGYHRDSPERSALRSPALSPIEFNEATMSTEPRSHPSPTNSIAY
ncbi:fungal pheromone STE3G-protein-coupled receptor [Peniophora sp. CONT]|nr:fungal pheromone STE3G-protein-coupled receptor [Peniophora sp. CONT]